MKNGIRPISPGNAGYSITTLKNKKIFFERWLGGSDWQSVIKGLCVIGLLFSIVFALWLYSLRTRAVLSLEATLVRPLYTKLSKQGLTRIRGVGNGIFRPGR